MTPTAPVPSCPGSEHLPPTDQILRRPPADPGTQAPLSRGIVTATAHWANDAKGVTPEDVTRWFQAPDSLPKPGSDFLGFHLEEELGRGAFGRVYLARQGSLAGRLVALKIACDILGESQTLAQLQHTNIVPIYSFHRLGGLQAVCMPYFGRTTLAKVISHLSGRGSMPSSGREFRSTVTFQPETVPPSAKSSGTPPSAPPGQLSRLPDPAQSPEGWTRLDGLSYVGAALWLVAQLADGLAHAHARGILHRDLKPANVLLTDDGRPMLLDFNLAEDTKVRGTAAAAAIGGTLPYMAPEQLRAYRDTYGALDARADIYSLGMILYELLTGQHAFPLRLDSPRAMLQQLLVDRETLTPEVRKWNSAVSPATEAIVLKCLARNPADRYQTAEQLREDIDRQLHHRPLKYAANPSISERVRKWAKRHPRLTSTVSVATVAAAMLIALGVGTLNARERARDYSARTRYEEHQHSFRDAQLFFDDRNQSRPRLGEALERLRGVLTRYQVPEDGSDNGWENAQEIARLPASERERLRTDVGETFYLMAQVAHLQAFGEGDPQQRGEHLNRAGQWNAAATRYGGDRLARAVREQQATLAELRGERETGKRLRAEAGTIPLDSARDAFLLGESLSHQGRHREAVPHLLKSTQFDPTNFSAWFVRGTAHLALEQNELAAMCFGACVALRGEFAPAWMNRGLALSRMRFFEQACDDYDRAIGLDRNLVEAYVQRAIAREALNDKEGAECDLSRALATGAAPVRVYFLRADVRERLDRKDDAKADREVGMKLAPGDELSWVARAENRLADDPRGALGDVEEALKLNPFSVFGLQLKAHILAERLDRGDDAVAVLNRAVTFHPDYVPARAGRGVLLARRGKRTEAIQDAKDSLLRDTRAPNLYQVACIYALTSGLSKDHPEDRTEALRLLWSALKTGFGLDIVDTDTDLDPLRKDAEFQRLVKAAREHHAAQKR